MLVFFEFAAALNFVLIEEICSKFPFLKYWIILKKIGSVLYIYILNIKRRPIQIELLKCWSKCNALLFV
jgi:hypothetical protein